MHMVDQSNAAPSIMGLIQQLGKKKKKKAEQPHPDREKVLFLLSYLLLAPKTDHINDQMQQIQK